MDESNCQLIVWRQRSLGKKIPIFAPGRFIRKEDSFGTIHVKQNRASKQTNKKPNIAFTT